MVVGISKWIWILYNKKNYALFEVNFFQIVHLIKILSTIEIKNVMCLRRVNSILRYSSEKRNVVYYDAEECNVKIELRMRLLRYNGA